MKILFIGAGNMANAISSSLKNNELYFYSQSGVSAKKLAQTYNSVALEQIPISLIEFDVVFLAMKPQQFMDVVASWSEQFKNFNGIVVSILAALSTDFIKKTLANKNIIRFMPNTPIQLKSGCGLIYIPHDLKNNQIVIKIIDQLSLVSKNINTNSDQELDLLTTISGCGPAYMYEIVANFQSIFKKHHISEEVSRLLIVETFKGALRMLDNNPAPIPNLIDQVTSKGGVTIAALEEFRNHQLSNIFESGINAAIKRTNELRK